MDNTSEYKCPKCNALLKLNEEILECEYCRSKFNLYDIDKSKKETNKDIYMCENCGIDLISTNTNISSCIYCKSKKIKKKKFKDEFIADCLIPFKVTKEEAIKSFKKIGKRSCLIPKQFNNDKNINNIKGVYIPVCIYNYDSTGVIEAECDKINTWKSGGYKYTKTDKYKVVRGGNISFENIPISRSKKIEKDLINSVGPFNYKELKKFDISYLSNFLLHNSDVSKDELAKEANLKIKNLFIEKMEKDINGYSKIKQIDNSINLYNPTFLYVLLPVWVLNIKYKNKIYKFAINGQTGKISKDIPMNMRRVIFIWISLFIIIFGILLLLNLFKVIL